MRRRKQARRKNRQKSELGLPDLEHVKSAVLVSLRSQESQRNYRDLRRPFLARACPQVLTNAQTVHSGAGSSLSRLTSDSAV